MSNETTRKKARKDTSYTQAHFDYIAKKAQKKGIAFAQVVRELLDISIPIHKRRKK